jgi:penicillin-binding protein 1C
LTGWLLDNSQPPTLEAPGQEGIQGSRKVVWLDEEGKRVAADCPGATQHIISLWPLPLEPWLPGSERRAARLPEVSAQCPPPQKDEVTPLLLLGVREGAILKRLPGELRLVLRLNAQGGQGDRWWFLNGEPVSGNGNGIALNLDKAGTYQVLVLDEAGQIAAAHFTLQ